MKKAIVLFVSMIMTINLIACNGNISPTENEILTEVATDNLVTNSVSYESTNEETIPIITISNDDVPKSETPIVTSEDTYRTLDIEKYSFTIPDYWEESGSKTEYYQAYAETSGKVAMLTISYPVDEEDDVTLEALVADNENMIKAIETWAEDCKVTSYETFESDYGVTGILYNFNYTMSGSGNYILTGKYFCFPSPEDNRWFYVTLGTAGELKRDYNAVYMDILASIRYNQSNSEINNSGDSLIVNESESSTSNSNTQTAPNKQDSNVQSNSSGASVTVPKVAESSGNLVWVPTNGGTKYHSKSSCSKMKDPIQVSIETAKKNGYTA